MNSGNLECCLLKRQLRNTLICFQIVFVDLGEFVPWICNGCPTNILSNMLYLKMQFQLSGFSFPVLLIVADYCMCAVHLDCVCLKCRSG